MAAQAQTQAHPRPCSLSSIPRAKAQPQDFRGADCFLSAVPHGSHQPHMVTKLLKCGATKGLNFKILFYFINLNVNLKSPLRLVASTAQCSRERAPCSYSQ